MSSRGLALVAFVVLTLALVVVAWRTVPWDSAGPGQRAQLPVSADFTPRQVERQQRFAAQYRPWSYSALALGVIVALVLGLTPWGARVVELVARPLGGGWVWRALLGGWALALTGQLATLPLLARAEVVLRRHGLSTQDWAGWWTDVVKTWLVGAVVCAVALLALYGAMRVTPRWWWAAVAAAGAVLVFALSFLFPVLVAPLFNTFTPMPDSPLRERLIAMAERDGVPVRDVLVADASRRTTALNAYVSGYGPTRRIVVYDTLLRDAPTKEVELVVAHELGHAKHDDVAHGTALAALGVAAAACLGYVLLTCEPLLRRAGVERADDPRSVGLVFALVALASVLTLPAQNLVSRRVEARADEHSLALTGDPATFIAMHRRLAAQNLSNADPNPVEYALFASHPSARERLSHARDHARRAGVDLPADVAGRAPRGAGHGAGRGG